MNEPARDIEQQARKQGATHYSALYESFYRPTPGRSRAWQSCQVVDGVDGPRLGWWLDANREYPPESAGRI